MIFWIEFFRDVSKFAMHFIVEEIDADTSIEELQKMMLVALVYRVLVCFYEVSSLQGSAPGRVFWLCCLFLPWRRRPHLCIQTICIWGAGGATPGKFLIGLRVVTCDSSVLVQPNRVLVVPATNVSLSAWVFSLLRPHLVFSSSSCSCPSYSLWPFPAADQLSEPWTRTFPSPSSSRPLSHCCSSSTIGLCMIWWRGPSWWSAPGSDDAHVIWSEFSVDGCACTSHTCTTPADSVTWRCGQNMPGSFCWLQRVCNMWAQSFWSVCTM